MRRNLRRVRELPASDRWLLLRLWWLLLSVDVALRLSSLRTLRRLIPTVRDDEPWQAGDFEQADRLCRLAAVAGRHQLYPMRCLVQALAVELMLARRGRAVELRIGVRRDDERVAAHAWLERGGRVLGDPAGARGYAVLESVGVPS